ncbi:TonB-dependent receptor [Alteromonas pelagimontana]|uniref:TonB-dependent receptor n=1 Tax=Alteromonas pelagimontana TaxID=1858656 RepID=A0A6M4MCA1_9ALTE|nr:TonB-dependent receptor [Alteromonas pelagimontana]QJR80762.1 TonB-dependent receptor [Alteromonas pelagimontana]
MHMFKWTAIALSVSVAFATAAQTADPASTTADDSPETQSQPSEANDVEIVEVKGVKQADLKARDLERMKNGFSSVISTDDLGNFVDQNVAESLRRLPGVTLQRSEGEGKYVTVRGLGPGFVSVNMNGSQMSGAGEERKVGLDALPADLLGTIEVLKTLTPDQNLNSIGGTVNVKAISAFDRGKNTLKMRIQDAYSENRGAHSPKFSVDGTQFFLDNTFGIGFALSHEERKTQIDETRHHSTTEMKFYTADLGKTEEEIAAGEEILAPSQLEYRREVAGRTRQAAALNLEFKPSANSYYYAKGTYTQFEDDDLALREFYDFQDAGSVGDGEIVYVNGQTKEFILSDIDVFHQQFIQESDNKTVTFSVGGENRFADRFVVDYEYAQSRSDEDAIGDRRVQFRERDLIVYGQGLRDNIRAQILSPEEAANIAGLTYDPDNSIFGTSGSGNGTELSNYLFDNLFLEDGVRTDEIKSANINLRADVFNNWLNYVKVGVEVTERDHARDKDRWSFAPSESDCSGDTACIDAVNSTLGDYASSIPEDSSFQLPFESRATVEEVVNATRQTVEPATDGEVSIESTKGDYTIVENTKSAFAMVEVPLGMDATLITGVRWAETEFLSTGYMSLENDDFEFNGAGAGALDIAIPLPEASITYSEFFPSAHVKWEPTENILVRGAVWTSFTRPSFKQARAYAIFDSDIELCSPGSEDCEDSQDGASMQQLSQYVLGSDNALDVGNPNLLPMTSVNYDASIGWYPGENLFLEAAIFYKDIDKFIVDVNGIGMSIADLPLTLPVNQVTEFVIPQDLYLNEINITINGDKAKVYGVELSYNQYFENGFFLQSNATLLDSEATLDSSIRQGKVALPDQADTTFNLVIGWESETFSARLIGNIRSDVLEQIGSCPASADLSDPQGCKIWGDQYQADVKSLDFKAQYDVTDMIQVYFDAINLTEEADLRYFQGNAMSGGNILYQKEEYGRSYQLGMNIKFY